MLKSINECYQKLGKSEVVQPYFDRQDLTKINIIKYHGFVAHPLSPEVYLKEPLLKKINDVFPIVIAGYLRMDPYMNYRWHKDTNRKVGINLLLTPNVHSYTLFGRQLPNWTDEQYKFIRLKYEPSEFYLFNTTVEHTVINFDETRWLFSVEFESDITYEDINEILR
jgi:hypothetical protein